jgi:MFS family permease
VRRRVGNPGATRRDDLRVILVSVLVVTCNVLPVLMLGALSNPIGEEVGFGEAAFGLMVGLFYLHSAVISLLVGGFVERIGPTRSLRLSAGAGALGMLIIVVVGDSWLLVTSGLLVTSFGMAIGTPAANLSLARRIRAERRGIAFGLKQASAPIGSLLAGLSVPVIAVALGWRAALLVGVVLSLAVVAFIPDVDGSDARQIDYRPRLPRRRQQERADGGRRTQGQVRSSPQTIVVLAFGFGFASLGSSVVGVFVVPTAIEAGIDIASAGVILAIASTSGIVTRVLAGWQADRRGRDHFRAIATMVFVGAVGYAFLGIGADPMIVTVGAIIGFAAGWGWNGVFALAITDENPSAPAVATGRTHVGGYVGSAVGPLMFGWLAQFRGYGIAWAVMVLTTMIGALIMFFGHVLVRRQAREEQAGRPAAA